MSKKPTPANDAPLYASVCEMNGARVYTSFSRDLAKLIAQTETSMGVIAIEEAHAGKPPVWTR